MSDKKSKFISKQVSYGGREITLYSLDGFTWSTRRSELNLIKERQEREKVTFSAVKDENGETKVVPKGGNEEEIDDEALNERFEDAEFKEITGETKPLVVDFLHDIPMLRMSLKPKEKPAKKSAKELKAEERARKQKEKEKEKAAKAAAKAKKVVKLPAAKVQKSKAVPASAKKRAAKVAPKKRATSKQPAKKAKVKAGKKRAA